MKTKTLNVLSALFIGVQLGFYVVILSGKSSHQNVMTFLPVITAFIYSLIILSNNKQSWAQSLALLFTVISDVFLMLVSPQNKQVAMVTFSIAQLLYAVRLLSEMKGKKQVLIDLLARFILCAVVEIVAVFVVGKAFDFLVFISVFYFTNLAYNLFTSMRFFNNSPLLALGLLFFIACDVFVGFAVAVDGYLNIPETSFLYKIAHPSIDYVHVFYVPSQTLIALSGNKYVKSGSLYVKLFNGKK